MTTVVSSPVTSMPVASHSRRAVTLLELLVAVSMIVVLVVVVGSGLAGRGSDGAALISAQNSLVSLVGATRAQAALHGSTARLLVYASPPPGGEADKYLRYLQVVRDVSAGSTQSTGASAGMRRSAVPSATLSSDWCHSVPALKPMRGLPLIGK